MTTSLLRGLKAEAPIPSPPDYKEIPYYLRQLETTDKEDKRVEFDKIIHDAVVNADLSDKKVVRALTPVIQKIQLHPVKEYQTFLDIQTIICPDQH